MLLREPCACAASAGAAEALTKTVEHGMAWDTETPSLGQGRGQVADVIRTAGGGRLGRVDERELSRLREQSGLRLDREGRFWHRDELIEHVRTQAVLHRGLHRAADGRWAARIGREWGYVEVEDAGRFLRRVEIDPAAPGALRGELIAFDWVSIDPGSLCAGADDALYARVPPDGERARLTRAAQLSLAPLLHEERGAFFLDLGGRRTAIGRDGGPERIRAPAQGGPAR